MDVFGGIAGDRVTGPEFFFFLFFHIRVFHVGGWVRRWVMNVLIAQIVEELKCLTYIGAFGDVGLVRYLY